MGSTRRLSTVSRAASPASVCSCDITLAAVPKSMTSAISEGQRGDAEPELRGSRRQPCPAARTTGGRPAAQIAARPEPTASAGPPTTRQSSSDHSTTRGALGSVAGVAARVAVTTAVTTYPAVNSASAIGTVQSRSPSAIGVGVGAVPGDRVADPLPEPPDRPRREQGDAERDGGDRDALDPDARAVRHQPAERPDAQARRWARRARRRR